MIRVVADANVLVSGILGFERASSPPGGVLRAWEAKAFELAVSDAIYGEAENALRSTWFQRRVRPDLLEYSLLQMRTVATRVSLEVDVTGVATHPEDDLVLAAAVSARADYLVTGDRQLLALGTYEGVRIVSPAEFLDALAADAGRD